MISTSLGEDTLDLVEQAGLPALVYDGGRTLATSEAARLLALKDESNEQDQLETMFGLSPAAAQSNPIRRALRSASFVSDRMVVKDGTGQSRLFEVTSMPKGTEVAVVLLREIKVDEPQREDRKKSSLEQQLERDGVTSVPGRPKSRGLAPKPGDAGRTGRERGRQQDRTRN